MKKPTLKQLLPILKFTKKMPRKLLTKGLVIGNDLVLTDLETSIEINDVNLESGLHNIETIHLLNNAITDDVEDFPLIDFSSNTNASFKTDLKTLEQFLPFISKDETRLHLMSVAWCNTDLVATDGFTLRLKNNLPENPNDSSLIPRTSLVLLIKLLKKFKVNEIELKFNEDHMICEVENGFTLKSRLINREYPKYSSIIPTKSEKSFTIDNWIDLKELKPLFNIHFGARIFTDNQDLKLEIKGSDFTKIIGKTTNEIEFGINVKYLDKVLKSVNTTKFLLNNEFSPIITKSDTDLSIVMPLKL